MKLNEIYDEEHAKRVQAIHQDLMRKQPQPDPAAMETKRQGYVQHNQKREQILAKLKPLAAKFTADQYDAFEREALKVVPAAELFNTISLKDAFDQLNPERRQQNVKAWDSYGRARAERDPSIVSRDGWTGD